MSGFVRSREFILIAPYAAWIGMMSFLPQTAVWYAARGILTAALLVWALANRPSARRLPSARAIGLGALVGLVVFLVWIAPEAWLARWVPALATPDVASSPYDPAVCGWPFTAMKLAASAFVIPVAEELFFRKWLVEFAGFWWMVALFAVEHGERWHVGALTGIAYGLLARRYGLAAAIVAHAVTNLALGLYVVFCGQWKFW